MPTKPSCFVIMPIRKEGTEDHEHFLSFYSDILKPTLEECGYEVQRGDHVTKGGAINRQIIERLAHADLVVADLTDLNPNVFYELGVRHTMRGRGTIVIYDEVRTDEIPFDLKSYRVIKYRSEYKGIAPLRRTLKAFVAAQVDPDDETPQNPVHDWLPLPEDLIAQVDGTEVGRLNDQINAMRRKLNAYRDRYGAEDDVEEDDDDGPLARIKDLRMRASTGHMPGDLLERAKQATQEGDIGAFLKGVETMMEGTGPVPSAKQLMNWIKLAERFGYDEVTEAIFKHARSVYPNNKLLRQMELGFYAHSDNEQYLERARRELAKEIGLVIDGEAITLDDDTDVVTLALFGVMLDAYHRSGLDQEAFRVAEAIVARFPNNTVACRNMGRSFEKLGREAEALEWFQKAIACEDVDDTSATWLGNELHNRRRHVDALEAYAFGLLIDPNEATLYAHCADEISLVFAAAMKPLGNGSEAARRLAPEIDQEVFDQCVRATASCPNVAQDDLERCRVACERIGADLGAIAREGRYSLAERVDIAKRLYACLRSEVTSPDLREERPVQV